MTTKSEKSVLPSKLGGGPQGLGDPEDQSLRKLEADVLIPKKMRDKAYREKCSSEYKAFGECCKASNVLMVVKCREENRQLWACMERWFKNDKYRKECTEEYLNERTIYRLTGVGAKYQKQNKPPVSLD